MAFYDSLQSLFLKERKSEFPTFLIMMQEIYSTWVQFESAMSLKFKFDNNKTKEKISIVFFYSTGM